MKINELQAAIREAINKVLAENNPAPAKAPKEEPNEKPGPAVAPGKPGEKPKSPRRPLGNPNVNPNPKAKKAKMNEEEMLQKIIQRFKSKK